MGLFGLGGSRNKDALSPSGKPLGQSGTAFGSHANMAALTNVQVSPMGSNVDMLGNKTRRGPYKFMSKIICTLGPKSRDVPILEELLMSGMNVARFNFSHGSHDYHQETLDNLRLACKNTGMLCAVLLDTKGPEIRTGMLEDGKPVKLVIGSTVTLTTDYTVHGNSNLIACSYPNLARDVAPGKVILCADGSITLEVLKCDVKNGSVQCKVLNDATLGERKNMNLPGVVVDLPTITEKDKDDLLNWGVKNSVDFVAASFVRKGSDIAHIRSVLGDGGKDIHIISKVENQEGLDNFADIVTESDGVMVARGDLGMEIPMEKIFIAQKRMIAMCNQAGKPVVTATQMLESMVQNPRPTRAEATDVANAVLDGTDCVMLSGETAAGAHPVQAVKIMGSICEEAENFAEYNHYFRMLVDAQPHPMDTMESLASSAVRAAQKVNAACMVVLSRTGRTARLIAKYRPNIPVVTVVVPDDSMTVGECERIARQSMAVRGLIPVVADNAHGEAANKFKLTMDDAIKRAKKMGLCRDGDRVVGVHKIEDDAVIKICPVK